MAGPFDNWTGIALEEAKTKLASNEESITKLLDFISNGEPEAFTKSGRDIKNMSQAAAKFGSTDGKYLGEIEGKTGQELTKIIASKRSENAILQAAIAAQELTPTKTNLITEPPKPPTSPGTPKTPPVAGALSKLNPILNFLQGMTYASDLNSGESAELAKRRSK